MTLRRCFQWDRTDEGTGCAYTGRPVTAHPRRRQLITTVISPAADQVSHAAAVGLGTHAEVLIHGHA